MKKEFLTDEERLFLEENLADVIELFKDAHNELREELKNKSTNVRYKLERSPLTSLIFEDVDVCYTCGYCFYFARIMKTIFPNFIFIVNNNYDLDHVLLKSENNIFDIEHIQKISSEYVYRDANEKDFKNMTMWFASMDKDMYEKLKYKFYRNIKEYLNKEMSLKCIVKTK